MATQDRWNQPCSDAHLAELSKSIYGWEEISPFLGLTKIDDEDIITCYPRSAPAQRIAMLRTWREKYGTDATYTRLAAAFQQCNRRDLLEKISELIAAEEKDKSSREQSDLVAPLSTTLMHDTHVCDAAITSHPSVKLANTHSHQCLARQCLTNASLKPGLDCNTSCSPPTINTASPSSLTTTVSAAPPLSHYLKKYAKYIREIYRGSRRRTPIFDEKLQELKVKAKSYINIVLVHKESINVADAHDDTNEMLMDRLHGHIDGINRKKTTLELSDVCKCEDGSLASNVLVEGAPGVGKTTFASELCKQWANGKLLQEWNIVIMIKLRDQRTRAAKTLYDLLYHPDPEIRQEITKELISQNGEGMLLILDGYDELSDGQKKFDSVVQQIMSRELLSQATLMVTSRPLARRTLHPEFQQFIDQHIEVLGFTQKNVEEFIYSACGDKPELLSDFKEYLSYHPFSSSLMYNPLQCAIVTNIYCDYWKHGEKECAPQTLTELYTCLVHTLLLRYLNDHHGGRNCRRIRDLTDLPDDIKQNLDAVTSLAADGIKRRQYVFDEADENVPADTLGLMQREEEAIVGIGTSTSHYFLHLTLQEYFAAVHYSDQLHLFRELLLAKDGPLSLKSFLKHYGEERNSFTSVVHWPVALFIAGRTKLSGIPTDILQKGLTHNTQKHLTYVNVSLLHLLYETQCPELIQSTLVTNKRYLSVSGNSALDWFVIGYCIANSASRWQVRKQSKKEITYDHMHHLTMGLNLGSNEEGEIESLQITDKSSENCLEILEWLQPHNKSVKELTLSGQKIEYDWMNAENFSVLIPALKTLEIKAADSDYIFLYVIVPQLQNNLQILSLTKCELSEEAASVFLHSLQSQCCRLQKLSLENCIMFIPSDLHVYPSSTEEKVFSLHITDESWLNILKLLKWLPKSVTELKLIVQENTDSKRKRRLRAKKLKSEADEVQVPLLYPALESLVVECAEKNFPPSVFVVGSQISNNFHTLSLKKCYLDCEATSSLFTVLQSPHCKIQDLALTRCTVTIFDASHKLDLTLKNMMSLDIDSSSLVISHLLSKPLFCSKVINEIRVDLNPDPPSSTKKKQKLEIDTSYYPVLTTLEIMRSYWRYDRLIYCFPSSSLFNFSTQQNNLHSLYFHHCKFNSEATASLIHSLQSSQCRLQELTLDMCDVSLPNDTASYSLSIELKCNETSSLKVSGSSRSIFHLLSKSHFFTNKLITLTVHLYEPDDYVYRSLTPTPAKEIFPPLKILTSRYPMLESLEIDTEAKIGRTVAPNFSCQQNNLQSVSLKQCKFSCEVTNSFFQFLKSPHCKLQAFTLDECIFLSDTTTPYKLANFWFRTHEYAPEFSLYVTGSSSAISWVLFQSLFYTKIVKELSVKSCEEEPLLLCIISSKYSKLEKLVIERPGAHCCQAYLSTPTFNFRSQQTKHCCHALLSPSVFSFSSQQNYLHTLSLKWCNLNDETTNSLIHALNSPHSKLREVKLDECLVFCPNHSKSLEMTFNLQLPSSTNKGHFDIKGSSYLINYILAEIHFVIWALTEVKLTVDTPETIAEDDSENNSSLKAWHRYLSLPKSEEEVTVTLSNYAMLECFRISCCRNLSTYKYSISPALNFSSYENCLLKLSLTEIILTSKTISSLVQFLQSPHCRLCKLSLYSCSISASDHNCLVSTIVNCSTILCFFLYDWHVESSLEALATGLRRNNTMEELAFSHNEYIFDKSLTEEQFQILTKAVDSSAIKKLWLRYNDDNKKYSQANPLSRKDIEISLYHHFPYI